MKMYVAIDKKGRYLTASKSQGWGGSECATTGTTADINQAAVLPMKYMKDGWDQYDTSIAVAFALAEQSRAVTLISEIEYDAKESSSE